MYLTKWNYGKIIVLFFIVLISSSCMKFDVNLNQSGISKAGQVVYNRVNLRTYAGNTILYSNHYHGGVIIPAGTECNILNVSRRKIEFRVMEKVYVLKGWLPNSRPSYIRTSFKKYFLEDRSEIGLDEIRPAFQESVLSGIAEIGMTKKEVLFCLGYPAYLGVNDPTYQYLPKQILQYNDWYYMKDNKKKVLLRFKGEKLFKIVE